MSTKATLEGTDGSRIEIGGSTYEFPEVERGPDADWVVGWVELSDPSTQASQRLEITWRTEEVERFASELRDLTGGRSARAELDHMEDQVEIAVRAGGGVRMDAFITDHDEIELRLQGVEISPEALVGASRDFGQLAEAFRVRSSLNAPSD